LRIYARNMVAQEEPKIKKLRALVISMGGERQVHMTQMFQTPELAAHFHPPTFSPGVPSRSIRNRKQLLHTCYRANLLCKEEWEAIENDKPIPDLHNDSRKGRKMDLEVPYSVEFWRKGKSLGRGRAVLACFLAHLIAIRTHVEDEDGGFDIILEDNVRPLVYQDPEYDNLGNVSEVVNEKPNNKLLECECAKRIRETINASEACDESCLLRYYGWLGSIENVQYVYNHHAKTEGKLHTFDFDKCGNNTSIFSFPTKCYDHKPGTAIWGAYAYWISPEAYHKALIPALRSDVGSILWKGKRMRQYLVKPIDKVIPRKVMEYMASRRQSNEEVLSQQQSKVLTNLETTHKKVTAKEKNKAHSQYRNIDAKAIHVSTHPAFYRGPMKSKIHTQWDVEFCKSTEVQFKIQSEWSNNAPNSKMEDESAGGKESNVATMSWKNLWLTETEKESVEKRYICGGWDAVESISTQRKDGDEKKKH